MACPFCTINKEKTRIVKEDKLTLVFLSNPRLMKGHLLVVPKRHVEKIADLTKEESDELMKNLVHFEELILKKIATGCDIRQNYRPFMADGRLKVGHLHFHLQPRDLCDELYEKCLTYETDLFRNLEDKETSEVLKLLG